jgi:hypothetical protein
MSDDPYDRGYWKDGIDISRWLGVETQRGLPGTGQQTGRKPVKKATGAKVARANEVLRGRYGQSDGADF